MGGIMIYGYVRVSTREQNLERQISAIEKFKKPDKVFCDKQSGKDFDRPEYQRLKFLVTTGDEVVIKELDRLGRNKEAIKEEIQWFKDKGVRLRILDVPTTLLDFGEQDWIGDMLNNILIEVLGAVAQNEREDIRRRQREGIDAMEKVEGKRISKKTRKYYGRPKIKRTKEQMEGYLLRIAMGEISQAELAREQGFSIPTFKKLLRDYDLV